MLIHGTDKETWDSFLQHATHFARDNGRHGMTTGWRRFVNKPHPYYMYRAYWEVRHLLTEELRNEILVAMTRARLTT